MKSPSRAFTFPPYSLKRAHSPRQEAEEEEEEGVDPLARPSALDNYEAYIKTQILSKMYLQQYVANNINPPPGGASVAAPNGSERLQCDPLDLSTRPDAAEGGGIQTKYQVSALLLKGRQDRGRLDGGGGRLVIGDVGDSDAGATEPPHVCTICGQIFAVQDR